MSSFHPQRDDYQEAVRALLDKTPLAKTVRAEIVSIEPGFVSARLPLKSDVTQQQGCAHAGIIATLADMVTGLAAYSLMPDGADVVSSNINLSLMRPGEGDYLLGRGRVIKAGNKLFFTEADILTGDGKSETGKRLIARATATMVRV